MAPGRIKRATSQLADAFAERRLRTGYRLGAVSVAGAAIPWVVAPVAARWVAPAEQASDALPQSLVLTGFLFIPASIFAPVLGSMFPSFWRATPVSIIRAEPFLRLLLILGFCVSYGVSATLASFVWDPTWPVVAPLLVSVALGGLATIWLIAYSLSLFDPEHLADAILSTAPERADSAAAIRVAGDLSRLVRGFRERERPVAAAHAIDRLTRLYARHADKVDDDSIRLTGRVLQECMDRYGYRPEVQEAVRQCRSRLPEVGPDGAPCQRLRAPLRRLLRAILARL
jgi:hypothetical protein